MLTGLMLLRGFLVLYAIMVKERSFEQSKPAGGQDWHFKEPCSSYIPLNQHSAFLSQESLSTYLLSNGHIRLCFALHDNYFNPKQISVLICFEPQAKK